MTALPVHLTCSNCGSGNDIATLLAAIASVSVAIVTFGVVVATFMAARAAVRSARATEGLLATQLAPRLINTESPDSGPIDPERPIGLSGPVEPAPMLGHVVMTLTDDGTLGFCSIPVRNVGAGLARLRSAQIQVRLRGAIAPRVGTTLQSWRASKRFLPSGETTRIDFSVQAQLEAEVAAAMPYALKIGAGIALHVSYSSAESEEEIKTTFVLFRNHPEDRWLVNEIFHSDLPETSSREPS